MKKINNNLVIFISLAIILGTGAAAMIYKFFQLFKHDSYVCKVNTNAFFIQFPHHLSFLLALIIALLITVFIARLAYSLYQIKNLKNRLIKQKTLIAEIQSIAKKHGLMKKLHIIHSKERFAFCLGICNPHIYISTSFLSLLNKNEIEVVLLHEKYHIDHRDSLIMLIAQTLKDLFPVFPVLSDLIFNYRIEREIKADRNAITYFQNSEPVVSVLKKLLCTPTNTFSNVAAIGEYNSLKIRIHAIGKKQYRQTYKKFNIAVSILMFTFLMGLAILPVEGKERDTKSKGIVCIQSDSHIKNASYPFSQKN